MRLETCGCLLFGVALAAATCSGIRVTHDCDPAVEVSVYRSWYWLPRSPSGDTLIENDLVRARVRTAVERTLAAKGYAQAPTGEGDLGVGWHAAIEGKVRANLDPQERTKRIQEAVDRILARFPPQ